MIESTVTQATTTKAKTKQPQADMKKTSEQVITS